MADRFRMSYALAALFVVMAVGGQAAFAAPAGARRWISFAPKAAAQAEREGPRPACVKIDERARDCLKLRVSFAGVEAADVGTKGGKFTQLSLPDGGVEGAFGHPRLPVIRRFVEAPMGAKAELKVAVTGGRTVGVSALGLDRWIMPAQPPVEKRPGAAAAAPFIISNAAYAKEDFTPAEPASLDEAGIMCGRRLMVLTVRPISYSPGRGEVRLHPDVSIEITFTEGDDKQPAAVSRPVARLLNHVVLNPSIESVGDAKAGPYYPGLEIITPQAFLAYINATIDAYDLDSCLGLTINVVSLDTIGSSAYDIYNHIYSRYTGAGTQPTYVLLVGDTNLIPTWIGAGTGTPVTDLYYSCMDGSSDWMPDLVVGRWPARNLTQAQHLLDKWQFYDYGRGLAHAEAALLAGNDHYYVTEATHDYGVYNYLLPTYYTCYLLYDYSLGATSTDVINAVNGELGLVVYSGHGSANSWADGPPISQANVNALTNVELPFVLSFACDTGDFNNSTYSECFAETWLNAPNGGAGFIGSSVSSYWGPDDILEKRWYRSVYDYGDRTFGLSMWEAKLLYYQYYGSSSDTRGYFEQYNLQGNPASPIWISNFGPDKYESDNSPGAARKIVNGQRHGPHSFHAESDIDYVTFTLPYAASVTAETIGPCGDTELELLNSSYGTVAYNDDYLGSYWSRISTGTLSAGTYYLSVIPYSNSEKIHEYYIELYYTVPFAVRVNGISWSANNTSATISWEASAAAQRYYYKMYSEPSYHSTGSTSATYTGLSDGYYLFIVTAKDSGGTFAPQPARVWFYNKPVGGSFQVYLSSYQLNGDQATLTWSANSSVSRYYHRLYGREAIYRGTSGTSVTYYNCTAGYNYFIVTGKQSGTGSWPSGGPARQWLYIDTAGF